MKMYRVKKIVTAMNEIDTIIRCLRSECVSMTIEGKTMDKRITTTISRDRKLYETLIGYYNNKYQALYEELRII